MNHEEKFMQDIHAFIAMDKQERDIQYLTVYQQELGWDECVRLTELFRMYKNMMLVELHNLYKQYTESEITTKQFQALLDFANVGLYGSLLFEQIEELEWRYQCVKERAIPMKH